MVAKKMRDKRKDCPYRALPHYSVGEARAKPSAMPDYAAQASLAVVRAISAGAV